jgi:hypothetical protein
MTTETASSQASELFRQSRRPILWGGLAIQCVIFLAVAYFIRPSTDTLILRYNAFFGVDILGAWWQAYLVPGMCLGFFGGNLVLAEVLARRQAFLAALVLEYGAFLVVLSEVTAIAALISINS